MGVRGEVGGAPGDLEMMDGQELGRGAFCSFLSQYVGLRTVPEFSEEAIQLPPSLS